MKAFTIPGVAAELVGVGYGRRRNEESARRHRGFVNDGKGGTYTIVPCEGAAFAIQRHPNHFLADDYRERERAAETELAHAQSEAARLKAGLEHVLAQTEPSPEYVAAFERDIAANDKRTREAEEAVEAVKATAPPQVETQLYEFPLDPSEIELTVAPAGAVRAAVARVAKAKARPKPDKK